MSVLGSFVLPHPPLVVHEVGHGEEASIGETVKSIQYIANTIARLKPDTIILSSPHAPFYQESLFISGTEQESGSLARFDAPEVRLTTTTDTEFVTTLCLKNRRLKASPSPHDLDHGTIVPLSFIVKAYPGFKFVRLGLSGLDRLEHLKLGIQIRETAQQLGRKIVFIASGDMSHRLKADGPYGLHPSGARFDKMVTELLSQGKLSALGHMDPQLCEEAGECGYRSLLIMSGVMDTLQYHSKLHSYEGPYGVGYACASFLPLRDPYVHLAKLAIRNIVLDQLKTVVPTNTPARLLNEKAGVFVTLHKNGKLRGCIGTISPTQPNIAQEIITCAIWAATEDYRFTPVRPEELDLLSVHVDVLGPAEKISGPEHLDVKKYGVIVTKGARRGLLLPDIDGVDTVKQQILIACQKAGISPDEAYSLERFEVIRHHD